MTDAVNVVAHLRQRADSYARDAERLWYVGQMDDALTYQVLRDELRRVAQEAEASCR